MNCKLEKTTTDFITVSIENNGLIIVADFSRTMYKKLGYIDAENVKFLNDEVPDNAASILSKMLSVLGDWVVEKHSELIN